MPLVCPASLRLTLSTTLHSVYRAELASEFRFRPGSPYYGYPGHLSYLGPSRSYHQLGRKRCFGSLSCLQSSQPGSTEFASHELSTTSTTSSITDGQQNTPEDTKNAVTEINNDAVPKSVKADSVASNSAVTENIDEKLRNISPNPGSSKKNKRRSKDEEDKIVASKTTLPPKQKKGREGWQIQKEALKRKFKEGWNPPKKLSPDAMEGIRHLHATAPDKFTTPLLAEQFKVSPEVIRRILKSKWRPSEEEMEDRRARWQTRSDKIWSQMAELGLRPTRKRADAFSDASRVLYNNRDRP